MVRSAADGGVVMNLHPAALDVIHFPIQDFPGQAVFRDTVAQPAAGFGGGLEDHRLITLAGPGGKRSLTPKDRRRRWPRLTLLGGSGTGRALPVHRSATNRFRLQMAIGSSTSWRRQSVSQGWGQMRPMVPGRGSRSMMRLKDS